MGPDKGRAERHNPFPFHAGHPFDVFVLLIAQVAHFSKYGLQDSDEEEEEHPLKAEAKKLKTTPVPPPGHQPPQQMALNGKPTPPAQVEGGQ